MRKPVGFVVIVALFAGLIAVGLWTYGPYVAPAPAPAEHEGHAEHTEGHWTCAMHPQVRQDHPGRCPVCGMDLTFRSADEAETSVIRVADEIRRAIGIVTVPVERGALGRDVRTVGRVEANEQTLHHIHTKVQGWIERLHADFEGAEVRAGDPLLTLYSPELLATQEEYLIALAAERELSSSPDDDARLRGVNLRSIAERRLRLFDVPEGEIARLEATGEPSRTVTFTAPVSGYVTRLHVRHGMEVHGEMELMTITDLSSVWVTADVYENEMDGVRAGLPASIEMNQLPGRTFDATIEYVYPYLEAQARTNRVRVVLPNRDLALKPGMYGDVTIRTPGADDLSVPVDAVVRTGTRDLVYVEREPGVFEQREVRLGPQRGDRYVVTSGLIQGEVIVARGNYFLDSEQSIRAAGVTTHAH
jgi:Cu(I)/Ag(I) efflux system membrane fusion protein